MAFDLYVTFSGLCLFWKRKESPLQILLPDATGFDHRIVVGYHVRYDPRLTSASYARFFEHKIQEQGWELRLDRLQTLDEGIDVEMKEVSIVNIHKIVKKPPNLSNAYFRASVNRGALCKRNDCEHEMGAHWTLKESEEEEDRPERMATTIHWKIPNVSATVGNREGLTLQVCRRCEQNDIEEKCLANLYPVNGQIRIYVFHTPRSEFPSATPENLEQVKPNHTVEHFRAYYKLFDGINPKQKPVPKLKSFEKLPRAGILKKKLRPTIEEATMITPPYYYGRRFNCILASISEE